MDKNQKIAVAVIAIIAIVAAWQLGKSPVNEPTQNQEQTEEENGSVINGEEQQENNNTSTESDNENQGEENMWEGKLEASDNTAKGNYKLTSGTHVIYIKTSRDYSSLVGKDVKVSYQGSLESFSLQDITAK